jgi:cellulose synthase/poly-beta-1,6-N-acetylglucosamine synthase-like glycosyltransferase
LKTLPFFSDDKTGAVQTRWEHINRDYSLITRLQAFQLNVHFTIEQTGRQAGHYFLQYNGTAGIWRRQTIEDAGGWKADTLTEDLDLSYRAQLRGWKIIYRQDIVSPAEMPVEMNGLKSQQFRWMKGGAENARKHFPALLKSELPLNKKFLAILHLLSSAIFLIVFILAVLSVPTLFLFRIVNIDMRFFWLFIPGMLAVGSVYYVANRDTTWLTYSFPITVFRFLFMFPVFLSLSMGLSLHNSLAIIEGYRGRKSGFVRTPKFNIQTINDTFRTGFYTVGHISGTTIAEGVMALYFSIAVVLGLYTGHTSLIVFHMMLVVGFGSVCLYSITHLSSR